MKYNNEKIAAELTTTALNAAYYGSALYAAKDIPDLDAAEKGVIHRYLNGTQRASDHIELQHIANKIAKL